MAGKKSSQITINFGFTRRSDKKQSYCNVPFSFFFFSSSEWSGNVCARVRKLELKRMEKYGCRFHWQFPSLKIDCEVNIGLMCFQNAGIHLSFFNCEKIPQFFGKVLFLRFQLGLVTWMMKNCWYTSIIEVVALSFLQKWLFSSIFWKLFFR